MNKPIDFSTLLVFDGAMGTMLQEFGIKTGELPENYNITYPEIIETIHRRYLEAGCDVITTNTFGANAYKLEKHGYSVEHIIQGAVAAARKAAGDRYVALDIGPIGQLMEPYGVLSFQQAYQLFAQQVKVGTEAGVDMILIETMSDLLEAKAAILAAKENSDLPVICSMTFQDDGRTLTGTDPFTMVNVLQGLGVSALGINCSLGPEEIKPMVEAILPYAKVPIIVQPNAGMPQVVEGKTVYDVDQEEFARQGRGLAEQGVTLLGGCCGTTPDYIKALIQALDGVKTEPREVKKVTAVSSSSTTVVLGEGVTIIGERINPTGKKKLKEALTKGNLDYILEEAIRQRDAGAHILDVNVGLPGIDEQGMMIKVVRELQNIVQLPLQIDSAHRDVIEGAVRIYNGKPIINSVNGKDSSMRDIFPIVKKYGAVVIGLTLDEKGIPSKAEDRVKIAQKIIQGAMEYGIDQEDIIIDCLVLTASAQQDEVKETYRAVRMVKEQLGVKTTLGVSNVSFGLPQRELLNTTFLSAVLSAGLDAPIVDPLKETVMDTINTFSVLWNYDQGAKTYLNRYTSSPQPVRGPEEDDDRSLEALIIDGLKEQVGEKTNTLLGQMKGMDIIETILTPALDIVGKRYEEGKLFLPQLIQSAEAVKRAFEVIKDRIDPSHEGTPIWEKKKILLATVEGDIHDIGKNIVRVLLENYGFEVIDLGKNVPIAEIVNKTREERIPLVGLSALMTTTVKSMEDTIGALRDNNLDCKVMVGGAVLTDQYAKTIGADYYARDARDGVEIAKAVFNTIK